MVQFRLQHEGGDDEIFKIFSTIPEKSQRKVAFRNNFTFRGFSNKLHPYYRQRLQWIETMMKMHELTFVLKIVPTIADITGNPGDEDKDCLDDEDFTNVATQILKNGS